MAGTRVKIDRGFGLPLGCNLYFLAGVDPNSHVRAAVESVLRPAQELRDDLIRRTKSPGPTSTGLPYVSVETKWRLQRIRGRSVPLLLSSGIPSISWEKLLESTWDGVLFHSSWDGDTVVELLESAEKGKGKRHRWEDVLKRAYMQGRSVINADRTQEGRKVQAESLSLLWLCSRDVLGRFANNRRLLQSGLSPCFIAFDTGAEPAMLSGAILQSTEASLHWERTVRELFEYRSLAEDQTWRVCEAGAEQLARFANYVLRNIPADYPVLGDWAERVWRITLLLHLLSEARGAVIRAETTWDAIRLSAWYLGRQIRLLARAGAKPVSGKLSKNGVLEKIRIKAPVSDHQLLRSFHRASKAQLEPVVTELLQDGLVRRDENGKLLVTERAGMAGR